MLSCQTMLLGKNCPRPRLTGVQQCQILLSCYLAISWWVLGSSFCSVKCTVVMQYQGLNPRSLFHLGQSWFTGDSKSIHRQWIYNVYILHVPARFCLLNIVSDYLGSHSNEFPIHCHGTSKSHRPKKSLYTSWNSDSLHGNGLFFSFNSVNFNSTLSPKFHYRHAQPFPITSAKVITPAI